MDCKLRPTFATPQENKPPRKQIMEGIYGSYRHKKISHSTQEVTEKMACLIGVEPTAFRLGVDSEPPNCSKIGNFLANHALLCVFFVYFALFFMFRASIFISFSNFYAKNYAITMLF